MKPSIMIIADRRGRRQVAMERGMGLAEKLGCEVIVVGFVFESLASQGISSKTLQDKARRTLLAQRNTEIKTHMHRLKPVGVKASCTTVWEKNIRHWVVEHCKRDNYMLVVKTGHRSETFIYSPTDWQLLRECPAPVMIVAENKWRKTRPIVAAVDLESKGRRKQRLNKRVIETAQRYAHALGCPLYVLHAIHISPVLTELDLVDGHSYAKKIKLEMQTQLKKLSARHDIPIKNFIVKQGPVAGVITSESAKLKAQLVVMGTVGRKGVRGKLIGNTAEQVLGQLRTDVLALKV
jgi:universal stress protein E